MTAERTLRVEIAALDRLDGEIFLMPPGSPAEAARRRSSVAAALVGAWSHRLAGGTEEELDELLSGAIRSRDKGTAAAMDRASRACWRATEGGSPLSLGSFVLVPGEPWMDAIKGIIIEELEEPDTADVEAIVGAFRLLLAPFEDQMRAGGLA